ncbi:hypothetical protein LAZ67_19001555 [Cordylochernes scorpioides]|uniref:Transposase n=1 Tax=Cordylochernes scorpioides TaxID=51811 RepID=A0ABY6LKM8_9ARAC|nr:hypothetical protein LAZ67_19001555 [Cordylochernes scorpioides]
MSGHRKRRQFKQTDAFTSGMVIGLKRAGWSIRQIAADTHLGASTVHRLWRRWLEQGNVAIYRNAGATRVTSARVDRRILRQAVAAPQATCTAILQHVQDTLDHSISTRTISRRLVANGLHSCRPLRRLPLTPPNRRQRLEWCRARSTWMTEWHRVVFSDESRFCLSSDSRRVRVWRRRGERSNPAAIVERPTVRQRGIMVWGAIAYDSRSPLLRIQGTMTAQRYVDDVLRPVTLPYLQGVPNALYQQDNARPHTARISQQALQDVQMLPWPPYSPDLSPIEHVWDIIGRRLHALPQPRSEDELWQMVEREWRAIPQDAIRTLIDSLPRRVAACIAVRGEIVDFLKLPKTTIYRVKKQFDEADSNKEGIATRKTHSRRTDRVRGEEFVKNVKEKIDGNPGKSMRAIAKEMDVGSMTIVRTIHEDLGLKSYALRKGQLLTENMKNNRKGKAAALLNNLKHDSFGMLRFFSDEKNFDVDQKVNPRNDRWICKDPSEIPVVMHTKFPTSVMVLGVISSEGDVMPPRFFEKGLRMNADTYINVLETVVKPWMDMVAAGRKHVFQQDSAPAHKAKKTQSWLTLNVPSHWDVNKAPHTTIQSVKKAVHTVMTQMDKVIVAKACASFRTRLETEKLEEADDDDGRGSLKRVFEWYKRFKEGREETADNERSGRPSTSTTPKKADKVLELVREDRRITNREVAEEAGISFGSTQSIMKDILGVRRLNAVLVPKDLTFDQKNARKETVSFNLEATTDDPELLKRETTQQASEWRFKNEPRPKKARKAPSKVKVMLTVFFEYQGIVLREYQQQGSTITADSYLGVLGRLREAIRQKRRELWRSKWWILRHDNAPAHTALKISKFLQDHSTSVFPKPPYSPDLAPCDFFLFEKLKKS